MLVVPPCYNEEVAIRDTILDIKKSIKNCEIWFIDNNSNDKTGEIALNYGARVFHEPKQGKGFAIRRAISLFQPEAFSLVFMTDGDHTYSIKGFEVAKQLILTKSYDLVVGRRILDQDKKNENRGDAFRLGHANGNRLLSNFFKYLFKLEIPDTLSGWRVMSVGYFASFTGGVSGFQIESELNVHAYRLSANVTSVDVQYIGRKVGSESKLSTFKDGTKILLRLVSLFQSERPLVTYGLLSIFPITASSILFRNVLNLYFSFHKIPNFPSLIVAVGGFVIGLLLFAIGVILQNVRLGRVDEARRTYISASVKNLDLSD